MLSRDINKKVLHITEQILQAAHHLHCRSYAGYTRTSTDQQKICWIASLFYFAIAAKCPFHCSMAFLILTAVQWNAVFA